MAVVVEFIGLPGCGKTWWRDAVASISTGAKLRAVPPHLPSAKLALVAGEFLRSPWLLGPAVRLTVASRRAGVSRAARVVFNLLYVRAVIRGTRSVEGVAMLDQGLVQGLWSAAWTMDCPATMPAGLNLRRLLKGLRTALVVVRLEVPTDVSRERARLRPPSTNPLDGVAADSRRWEVAAESMERVWRAVLEEASADPSIGTMTFEVSGGGGSPQDVRKLATRIAGEVAGLSAP